MTKIKMKTNIKEISIMNKIILIHFLEYFGFPAVNNQEISTAFHSKGTPINITNIGLNTTTAINSVKIYTSTILIHFIKRTPKKLKK